MITKGIRGAITVDNNTAEDLKLAVLELLGAIVEQNKLLTENISHVIFTVTPDINADFPAKFARLDFGWTDVAMMCYHEMDVKGALQMCLRVMIVYNCDENFRPEFVYLKGAQHLR